MTVHEYNDVPNFGASETEQADRLSPQALRQALLPESMVPPYEKPSDESAVEVSILGAYHVQVDDKPKSLRNDEVFILNGLRLLRGEGPVSAARMSELEQGRSKQVMKCFGTLAAKLTTRDGEPLLEQTGARKDVRYALGRMVLFVDRPDPAFPQEPRPVVEHAPRPERVQKRSDNVFRLAAKKPRELIGDADDGQLLQLPEAEDETEAEPQTTPLVEIVRRYRDDPRVARLLSEARVHHESGPGVHTTAEDAARWISYEFGYTRNNEKDAGMIRLVREGQAIYEAHGGFPQAGSPQEAALQDATYAYQYLLVSKMPLIMALAKDYTRRTVTMPVSDLCHEGVIGIKHAIEKYESDKGTVFATYATYWVRHHMERAIGNTARTIRMPIHLHERSKEIGAVQHQLIDRLQRHPDPEEIVAGYNERLRTLQAEGKRCQVPPLTIEELAEFSQKGATPISFSMPVENDGAISVGDTIVDEQDQYSVLENMVAATTQLRQLADERLTQPAVRDKQLVVLALLYGLNQDAFGDVAVKTEDGVLCLSEIREVARHNYGEGPLLQQQVAELLGVGREYIGRLYWDAVKRMRQGE